MPHSPYQETVYPPIRDVDEYRQEFILHRARMEEGDGNKYAAEELLDLGEPLVEHCDFLEAKLQIKKKAHDQLAMQNDKLRQENEALKQESQAQKKEIAALRTELEKADDAAGSEEEEVDSSDDDGIRVEANSQVVKSELREAEKPEESEGSSVETVGMVDSRKRGAETDDATDREAVKKGRTV